MNTASPTYSPSSADDESDHDERARRRHASRRADDGAHDGTNGRERERDQDPPGGEDVELPSGGYRGGYEAVEVPPRQSGLTLEKMVGKLNEHGPLDLLFHVLVQEGAVCPLSTVRNRAGRRQRPRLDAAPVLRQNGITKLRKLYAGVEDAGLQFNVQGRPLAELLTGMKPCRAHAMNGFSLEDLCTHAQALARPGAEEVSRSHAVHRSAARSALPACHHVSSLSFATRHHSQHTPLRQTPFCTRSSGSTCTDVA